MIDSIDIIANLAWADALTNEADNPESEFYAQLDGFLYPQAQLDVNSRDYERPQDFDEFAQAVLDKYTALPEWQPLWDLCDTRPRLQEQMLCDAYFCAVGHGVGFRDRDYPDSDLADKLNAYRFYMETPCVPYVRRK